MLSIKQMLELSPEEIIALIGRGDLADVQIITLPLDVARTNKVFEYSGLFLGCIKGSSVNANADIEVNHLGSGKINYTQGLYLDIPFNKFYMTNTAQAGESLTLICASINPLFQIKDNRSNQLQASSLQNIDDNTDALEANTRGQNGDTGTQINASGTTTNTTVIIKTVTAGKNLYLTNILYSFYGASTDADGSVFVTDDADNTLYTIFRMWGTASGVVTSNGVNLSKPIKIPAGYKVKVKSAGTSCSTWAFISGWEE